MVVGQFISGDRAAQSRLTVSPGGVGLTFPVTVTAGNSFAPLIVVAAIATNRLQTASTSLLSMTVCAFPSLL